MAEYILNEDDEGWMDLLDFIESRQYEAGHLLAMVCALQQYIEEQYELSITMDEDELEDELEEFEAIVPKSKAIH